MKKKAWVTGGTCKDVAAMAVLALNIKETNPSIADEFVIFHDGISLKDQRLINCILPTRFIRYFFPGDQQFLSDTVTTTFSPMVFCKYECFTLLEDYEFVIWTDYDVVFTKSLEELNLIKKCSSGINLIPPIVIPVREHFLKSIENIYMGRYNLEADSFSLPLFVLNDNLRNYKILHDWCIKTTVQYAPHLYLPEQAIFNLMLQEFHITPDCEVLIRMEHPTISQKENIDKAHQIHAYGQPKFWNGIQNEEWEKNYSKWVKLGGSKIIDRTKKYKILKKIRTVRQKIVRTLRSIFILKRKEK